MATKKPVKKAPTKTVKAAPSAEVPKQNEQPQQVQLDLNVLNNILQIVDYACEQGAFRGWASINGVKAERDKLATFLEAIPKPKTEEAA
jgi:hypothetical protein